jgi:hypothetical protein
MKAADYHRWWMASRIGLGHPLEDENYAEIEAQLSSAGMVLLIVLHLIPHGHSDASTEYFIFTTEAVLARRWAAAARRVGALRLAIALEQEAAHEFQPETASLFLPTRYYPDVESHGELRVLAEVFADLHQDQLQADVRRHGDHRGEFPSEHCRFHAHWLRLVQQKHTSGGVAECSQRLSQQRDQMLRAIAEAQRCLADPAALDRTRQVVLPLISAWQELQIDPAAQYATEVEEWLVPLKRLIACNPQVFPQDMRPPDPTEPARRFRSLLSECLDPRDVDWLINLGTIDEVLLDAMDNESGGGRLRRPAQYFVELCYRPLPRLTFPWGQAALQLDLSPHRAGQELGDTFRGAVEDILTRVAGMPPLLAGRLVDDFRLRFLPAMIESPFAAYEQDVSDAELIDEIEGMTLQVTRHDQGLQATAWFAVPWDEEYGVDIEIPLDDAGSD